MGVLDGCHRRGAARCSAKDLINPSPKPTIRSWRRPSSDLRPQIREALEKAGLDKSYYRFDRAQYNPALPVAANLFLATPRQRTIEAREERISEFLKLLQDLGIEDRILRMSREVVEMLNQTFGVDGTDHPLFQQLGFSADDFTRNVELFAKSRDVGLRNMAQDELEQMLTLPFQVSAERIGPAFNDEPETEPFWSYATAKAKNSPSGPRSTLPRCAKTALRPI